MNKIMGYVLICIGILITVTGIFVVKNTQKGSSNQEDSEYLVVTSEDKPEIEPITNGVVTNEAATEEIISNETGSNEVVTKEVKSQPAASRPTSENSQKRDIKKEKKEKGDAFENFVCNLLADWQLKLLERTQDAVSSEGVVAESSKNPDLHISQKYGKSEIDYYLECKYMSRWKEGSVNLNEYQVKRYREFQRAHHRKVLIALGVGGTPASPKTFMIVPLDSIKGTIIRQIDTQFVVSPTTDAFKEYMAAYFENVFKTHKERKKK